MNESEIRSRFPNASASCIAANAPRLQPAKPEPITEKPLGCPAKGKEKGVGRVAVRYRIYRTRLQDSDNAWGGTKALSDGLRFGRLISDDNPEAISLTVEQEKVSTKAEERVEIELIFP